MSLPNIGIRAISPPGEIRVVAHLRGAVRTPFVASLRAADAHPSSVTTDSVAVFRHLDPGSYTLRVSALLYSSSSVTIPLPRDSGRRVDVHLRYGGVSICEDGPTESARDESSNGVQPNGR